jgi:hypothetical protein
MQWKRTFQGDVKQRASNAINANTRSDDVDR